MDGAIGMLEPTLEFIEKVNKEFDLHPKRVIDIGSKEQKDQGRARELFPDSEYLGVDFEGGPNVDIIADAYHLDQRFHRGHIASIRIYLQGS